MSDTEEVVLSRAPAKRVNTKPEIAREKLKEKRERLKKEKENLLIEEAKKRLAEDNKKAEQEALLLKQKEEEQKQKDPSYALLMKMEQMMSLLQPKVTDSKGNSVPEPIKIVKKRGSKKAIDIAGGEVEIDEKHIPIAKSPLDEFRGSGKKKVTITETEDVEEEEKPKRKPRQPKQVVDKPNKSPGLPKPRKKVVYLQQDPVQEESTQFVGYDVAPPAEPIQYQPSSGLLSAMMSRRNMNTAY
jgi:hypothetical protein